MRRHLSQGLTEEAEGMANYKSIQGIMPMLEYHSGSK